MDRRGHVVLQPRRPDDPVLHLLLDVRLPAGRRPRLGRRRQPHARVPARRHRGPDDAQRRGPAARGRPLAPAERDDPELRLLRPDVRLRARRDHPRGPAADDQRAGGRLLLPHADERELSAPGDAGGRGGGHPARDVPAAAAAEGDGAKVQLLGSGTILREVLAGAELLRDDFGVERRRLERPELHRAAARGHGGRALEHAAPGRGAASGTWIEQQLGGHDRPGDRGDGLHALVRGPDPPVGRRAVPRARHGRLRPQRLPQDAALVLRGGPPPRRAGGADRAGEDGRGRRGRAQARRSSPTASTPSGPRRGGSEGGDGGWHRTGPRPGHRGLRRRTGDRGPGRGGGHRRRRGPAGRAGVRQGDDGGARRRRAGKVAAIEVAVGDKVKEGSPIVSLEVERRQRRRRRRPSRRRRRSAERSRGVAGGRRGRDPGRGAGRAAAEAPAPPRPRRLAAGRHGRGARLRVARRAPAGARARRRPDARPRVRPQGPDHQGGRAEARKDAPRRLPRRRRLRPRSPAWTSPRGRRSTSSASARSSASRSPGSRRSAARTWPATG